MEIRPLGDDDREWTASALRRAWGSTEVARMGVAIDAGGLPGYLAVVDGDPVGLLTFARVGDEIEVVTLHVEVEGGGIGRALMDALLGHARQAGARRIWLVTTNDNIRAMRFYQLWGMDLVAFARDGVEVSRRVKSSIPKTGHHGIPVRHELVFEMLLVGDTRGPVGTLAP